MGRIVSIVGNLGAGKTTLTKLLCDQGSFFPYWESPEEHPFQADFTKDFKRWALANQLDFFLFRCEQEALARQKNEIAVMDGGFDQDYHVFTKNLYHKDYLTEGEFKLCERYYRLARGLLPPPDIIIRIIIDTQTLMKRRKTRCRHTVDQQFDPQEFIDFERLLDEWLQGETNSPVLQFAFDKEIYFYTNKIEGLITQIRRILHDPGREYAGR